MKNELKSKVILLNKEGKTNLEISKIIDKEPYKIAYILRKLGLKSVGKKQKTEKSIFTIDQEMEICKLYREGKSTYEIATLFNSYYGIILQTLKRNHIVMRSVSEAKKQFTLNDNYFDTIDSKDKAYFLGLLVADGSIQKNTIGIVLKESDKQIIDVFSNYINYTGSTKIIKRKLPNKSEFRNYYRLIFSSIKMVKDLSKYGVVPNKTYHTYFPNIPKNLWSHFIRGVFDGDGSISIPKNRKSGVFNIVGSFKMVQEMQKIITHSCKITETKLSFSKNKDFCYLIHHGKKLKNIYEYIYKDCDCLYISRKKEKFEQILLNF